MPDTKGLTILLAVDGSLHSEAAVRFIGGMRWPVGTWAHVLAVVPERWSLLDLGADPQVAETLAGLHRIDRAAAESLVANASDELHANGLNVETEVREGRPSELILQRIGELPADLTIIGAKGLGAPDEFRLGSTAHKLVHYACRSVLVARPPERAQPLNVILASDGSPEALQAADLLCALAVPRWAEVTVVGVVEITASVQRQKDRLDADIPAAVRRVLLGAVEAHLAAAIERLRSCSVPVRSAVRFGHPAGEILAAAREQKADLIVIGARGRTRAEPFRLGGVAQKVVKYAPCSVMVVR
jgi:nucleotide-binding universal stress UspA family protein